MTRCRRAEAVPTYFVKNHQPTTEPGRVGRRQADGIFGAWYRLNQFPELSRNVASTPYGRSVGSMMNWTPAQLLEGAAAVRSHEDAAAHPALRDDRLELLGRLRVEHRRPRLDQDQLEVRLIGRADGQPAEPVVRHVGADLETQLLGVEIERGDLVERAENGGLAPVVNQVVVGQGRRDDVLRHRLVAGVHRVLAVGELRQVRLDLAERLVTGPPEQHRRALVLLATLELGGLLD